MKSPFESKRTRAILGIVIVAIGVGVISKKVISYPNKGCTKEVQEIFLNINK